jgi:hypothetical protein
MYLTALQISGAFPNSALHSDFCVGEIRRLADKIRQEKETDALIVWEHHEMAEIVSELGIPLTKWRKMNNEYGLVFLVEVKTKQLYYDCFDFLRPEKKECSARIDAWLQIHGNKRVDQLIYPIPKLKMSYIKRRMSWLLWIAFLITLSIYLKRIWDNYRRREYTIIL